MAITKVDPLTRIEKGSALNYLEMDTNFTGAATAINTTIDLVEDIVVPDIEDLDSRVDALTNLQVPDLKALASITPQEGVTYRIISFYDGWDALSDQPDSGISVVWNQSRSKIKHNVYDYIAPERIMAWNGTQTDLATLYATPSSGTGCWEVVNKCELGNNPKKGGAMGNGVTNDTLAIQKALASSPAVYFTFGKYIFSDTLDFTQKNSERCS